MVGVAPRALSSHSCVVTEIWFRAGCWGGTGGATHQTCPSQAHWGRSTLHQGLCQLCLGQGELCHLRERSRKYQNHCDTLPKTTMSSKGRKLQDQHLSYSKNSCNSRTVKTRILTQIHSLGEHSISDQSQDAAAPKAHTERSRSWAGAVLHPYAPKFS